MSSLTPNDTRGLMEAYAAMHDPELRANLEEQKIVEELGFEIIENAAHVLFSQGYTVEDLCDYFEEANIDVIAEDFVGFTEGKAYLSESLMAPKEYVEEQFRQLNEVAGLVRGAINLGSKIFGAGAGAMKGGAGAKGALGAMAKSAGRSLKQGVQAAGQFAKTKMGQIGTALKGAAKAAPTALKGAVKGAAKIGGRALPGVGAALYGMDAASRFKKGDWGGGLLSTAGAVTSLVPGAGLVAGLAPAGIQMATDAMGLTGDKSKKASSSTKPTPSVAPKPAKGAGMVNVPGKGQRYYASSDKKYYKNYNDALAARRSRRGETVTTPTSSTKPASAPEVKATNTIASKSTQPPVAPTSTPNRKPATGTLGSTSFERRTPTSAEFKGAQDYRQQNPNSKPEDVLKAAQEAGKREKQKTEVEKLKSSPSPNLNLNHYEYDAFDLVLEYLLSEGHVDTVDEAFYVMMEMDSKCIQSICEGKKWIQKAIKHPGALSKQLGVPEKENIPAGKLKKAAKAKGTLGKRARLAMTLKGLNKE